jgi:hypothetical protein
MTSRMSPPAAANRTARDRGGERGHRASRCLERNPVSAYKRQCLSFCHDNTNVPSLELP